MRVLAITNAYPPHAYGGYELTCFDTVEWFCSHGVDVRVLTSDTAVPGMIAGDEPEVYRTLRAYWDWNANAEAVPASPIGRLSVERRNARALRSLLDEFRPTVVSVWNMAGLSLGLLTIVEEARIPIVLTMGNEWLRFAPDMDGWLRIARRWPFVRPRSVFRVPTRPPSLKGATVSFVSDFTKRSALRDGGWKFAEAVIAQPGISTRDFPLERRRVRRDPFGWRLLYVGRLDPNKGIESLLRAVAVLPATTRLDIVGAGGDRYVDELSALASRLEITERVRFGRADRASMRDRYRAADVLVFPSVWDEPFGLVPIEAMACGVPVVASGTGGSSEFLADGTNCVLFTRGDHDSLAAALMRLAESTDLRERVVAGGFDTAERLTADRYAGQLFELHLRAEQRSPARGLGS